MANASLFLFDLTFIYTGGPIETRSLTYKSESADHWDKIKLEALPFPSIGPPHH